jgi:hypothetical protein
VCVCFFSNLFAFHYGIQLNTILKPICCNLSLGLVIKARACKVASQKGSSRVIFHALGNAKKCEKMNPHIPKWTPILGIKVPMDSKIFREQLKGSKPIRLKNFFISLEKLLKRICLKWARMTHLDIWNTNYGQKKGRESNWQFDSRSLKVENRPNFLACRWFATYPWKALDKGYNFASKLISIGVLHTKLKVLNIFGLVCF